MPELRGIVLHGAVFDESHRVVETLTREEGKLGCIARGARASKKRFAGGLDIFSTLAMIVEPGRGALWRLESAVVVKPRIGLRSSLERFERASRLTECARLLTNPHQPAPEHFEALELGLDACDAGDTVSAIAGYTGLLSAAGIMPDQEAFAERSMRFGARDLDALASGRASDSAIADRAEDLALRWVEQHVGHTLKTRVTAIS
jgi:DNA repair protein RecO (recombination protein O)